jgi:type IV pilus assembly protein PilE
MNDVPESSILKITVDNMQAKKQSGFTLIELMIVVVIVSILAAIGYPAYTDQVIRGKRAEGRAALMDAATRMERFYSDSNQYATTMAALNYNATTETGKYNLAIGGLGADNQTFTLTATPTFTDTECGNLTLNQAGTKGISGTGNINECWGR